MSDYQQAKKILDNAELIYSADEIQQSIVEIAAKINATFKNTSQPVIVMPIMNGGLIISGNLLPLLDFPIEIDYIHATRYRNEITGGNLQWKVKPKLFVKNRTLLIIDDILDEGYTLKAVVDYLKQQNVADVFTAILIEKNHKKMNVPIVSDFVGLSVEDRYVFGFGMDYKGYHRNINAIYAVKETRSDE